MWGRRREREKRRENERESLPGLRNAKSLSKALTDQYLYVFKL